MFFFSKRVSSRREVKPAGAVGMILHPPPFLSCAACLFLFTHPYLSPRVLMLFLIGGFLSEETPIQ